MKLTEDVSSPVAQHGGGNEAGTFGFDHRALGGDRGLQDGGLALACRSGLRHDPLPIANNPSGGGAFPVGTIIQIVPTEAMVKRRPGFSAMTHDWEFFALGVSAAGTTITKRGTTDVVNAFNGNCFSCHVKAMPAFDLVCGTTHGCDALRLSESQLVNLQNSDARCP